MEVIHKHGIYIILLGTFDLNITKDAYIYIIDVMSTSGKQVSGACTRKPSSRLSILLSVGTVVPWIPD